MINPLTLSHLPLVVDLWNNASSEEQWIYQPVTSQDVERLLFQPNMCTIGYWSQDQLIAFLSGVVDQTRQVGYLTMVYVQRPYRRSGIACALLKHYEEYLLTQSISTMEVVFRNPSALTWVVPNTNGHDHPNAPGVLIPSDGYDFLISQGYKPFAIQEVYHQDIRFFQPTDRVLDKQATLTEEHITVTQYDAKVHIGLSELFDNLDNPSWKQDVDRGLALQQPLLVVVDHNKVIGFAGPLFVQSSGRGYFAGIGVHRDYRNRGVASVLFSALCTTLSQMGATYMTLFTGQENPARHVYLHAGFQVHASFVNLRKSLES